MEGRADVRGQSCLSWLLVAMILIGVPLALSGLAAADPIYDTPLTPFELALLLLFINLPLNLFWFSLAVLLALGNWEAFATRVSSSNRRFLRRVFLSAIVISVLGALIDVIVIDETTGEGSTNIEVLAVALAFIFISVYIVSLGVMKMGLVASLAPAVLLTAMNPPFWVLRIIMVADDFTLIVLLAPLAFIPLCAASMYLLKKWHKKRFVEGTGEKVRLTPT